MKRIVIKLGTGILTKGIGLIDTDKINALCSQIAEVRKRNIEVLVVSSGAIGMGMGAMGRESRPTTLAKQQALAAIGQSRLIQCWQDGLQPYDILVGQILLTHEGLSLRNRYVNAKTTIDQLLKYGVVPIINENDSISTYEIRFGNNDLLGAMVASLSESDHLLMLSTVSGLIDMKGSGAVIRSVPKITPQIEAMAQDTDSPTAVGGMISKIHAAKLATQSGCATYIADGSEPNIMLRILDGEEIGTRFEPVDHAMVSKKRWLAYFQRPSGSIWIDQGASTALRLNESSLLAAGVTGFEGSFAVGDVVEILDPDGTPIAHGETNYSSHEIDHIASKSVADLNELFPDRTRLEVVHRDALVLL